MSEKSLIRITAGPHQFTARFEDELAPETCAAFRQHLPFHHKLAQARWSGQATFISLRGFSLGVGFENATSYPAAGEILFYPGGYSNPEILFPYGGTCFACPMGQLAGNHFLTVVEGNEQLTELGRLVHWEGAQDIVFEAI